jgi:hypothetical protein
MFTHMPFLPSLPHIYIAIFPCPPPKYAPSLNSRLAPSASPAVAYLSEPTDAAFVFLLSLKLERPRPDSVGYKEEVLGWGRPTPYLRAMSSGGGTSTLGGGGPSGSGGPGGGGGGGGGPCGACKFLRRKCVSGCIFAPYFDSEQGAAHFAAVHKVFGASNVSKLLLQIPAHKRLDAVVTICYEAQARLRDPVYGCVAHIFALQQQVLASSNNNSVVRRSIRVTCVSILVECAACCVGAWMSSTFRCTYLRIDLDLFSSEPPWISKIL